MSARTELTGSLFLLMILAAMGWSQEVPKGPQALKLYPGTFHAGSADEETWLTHDDGVPIYYFPLPDQYGDHYFNVRFVAPAPCSLLAAQFAFDQVPGDSSTLPDLHVLVWNSISSHPDSLLDSLVLDETVIQLQTEPDSVVFTYISLDTLNLTFGQSVNFHVGWEPELTDTSDGALAILSDDGIPETSFSGEYWEGHGWGTIQQDWGLGVNFLIRVLVETYAGVRVWLDPDRPSDFSLEGPYPNPFNPEANLVIHLRKPQEISLEAYDFAGRLVDEIVRGAYPAGQITVNWQPQGLSSGAYLLILKSDQARASTRAVFVK